MLRIEVDARSLVRLEEAFRKAGNQAPHAIRRALNWTGDRATTLVTRALAKQTGAKYGAVKSALKQVRANYGTLAYRIVARGPAIPLNAFGARQTRKGVSAAPWNTRRVFPHTFIVPAFGGNVFVRETSKRAPLKKLWGPAIPNELVRGESKEAFERTVATQLPARLEHEIMAILSGAAPRG